MHYGYRWLNSRRGVKVKRPGARGNVASADATPPPAAVGGRKKRVVASADATRKKKRARRSGPTGALKAPSRKKNVHKKGNGVKKTHSKAGGPRVKSKRLSTKHKRDLLLSLVK